MQNFIARQIPSTLAIADTMRRAVNVGAVLHARVDAYGQDRRGTHDANPTVRFAALGRLTAATALQGLDFFVGTGVHRPSQKEQQLQQGLTLGSMN